MIISASRRTDIPAFFGDWFMNRIRAGYFLQNNSTGVKQQKIISLMPEDVDCFVFWSKYPAPFLKNLEPLDKRGYRYYFQYTLNDYPLCFEPHLPILSERTDVFKRLSEKSARRGLSGATTPSLSAATTPLSTISNVLPVLLSCWRITPKG
ncbi:MAG TPA: hypothetical protein DCQ14_06720 [Firmicutes bacterium]|nr:hypothetical protein [Bacillota bacterium]